MDVAISGTHEATHVRGIQQSANRAMLLDSGATYLRRELPLCCFGRVLGNEKQVGARCALAAIIMSLTLIGSIRDVVDHGPPRTFMRVGSIPGYTAINVQPGIGAA